MNSGSTAEQNHARTSDTELTRYQRAVRRFGFATVTVLQLLLILTVAVATILLIALFVNGLRSEVGKVGSLDHLQALVQDAFSGVLMVILGLELLETLTVYFKEHHIRLEIILLVAIIAVGRSVFQFDLTHTTGLQLLSYGALILSLVISYVLVRNTHRYMRRSE